MKIVLIDPKGLTLGLNSGLGYLASSLKKKGHKVTVIDFNNKTGNEKKRLLKATNADYVGISIKSFTLAESIRLAKEVKKINNKAVLIAGGPHITIDGYNFLNDNKEFDIVVLGEAENAILDITKGKKTEKIKGIIYRKNGNVISNGKREWKNNLNRIPLPDYGDFDSVINNKIETYPLVTSRGCPYNCTYCSVCIVIGKIWRARKPENIIEELKQAKKRYGIKAFNILDDNFTLDIKRVKKICQLLIDNNLNLRWSCPNGIRADRIDKELIQLMKKSGCYSISFGIESGNKEVFDKINKGEQLSDVENAIKMAKSEGIEVNGFFIIGLPGSTYKKDKESMEFAKKLELNSSSWGILVPYPGTKIWDWMNENKDVRILKNWKEGFHIGIKPSPVFETRQYKANEMIKAYYIANIKFIKKRKIPKIILLSLKAMLK